MDTVFNSNTGNAGDVNSGFDGEAHARLDDGLVAATNGWEFVGTKANAMA